MSEGLVFNMVGGGGGGGVKLTGITITTPPSKTTYTAGETFDPAGMIVTATYSNGATLKCTGYSYEPSTPLAVSDTKVTIQYTEGGITKTAEQAISVTRTLVAVPAQSGSLTYTGSAQSPTWSNYDSTKMTIGGVTSGTNAGSYNATFTLKDTALYCWPDGTLTVKTVAWSIDKAAGSLSISPTSMTLDTTNKTKAITVTRAGDGAITASSSNTAAATVSVSGNIVTVTGKASGSATITVSVAADTNHNAPSSKTCAVTVSFLSTTLNDNDWATIRQVSDNGQGANYWSVGDRKEVALNGTVGALSLSNVTTYAFIIGFNHNSSVEGSGRIHFQLGKTALSGGTDVCLCDSSYFSTVSATGYFSMNGSETNSGGWASSQMRTNICGTSLSSYSGTIIAVIPTALRAVLKSVTKYTDNNGNGSSASAVTATTDYFFLLSEYEVFGKISKANSNEASKQAQYAYYSAGNSKIKYKHDETSTAASWWLRSPLANSSKGFISVRTDGTYNFPSAHWSIGFTPGFCV